MYNVVCKSSYARVRGYNKAMWVARTLADHERGVAEVYGKDGLKARYAPTGTTFEETEEDGIRTPGCARRYAYPEHYCLLPNDTFYPE